MNREKIIRMAEKAGAIHYWHLSNLERFAELVASLVREQEREKWMERTAILIRGEREACAKMFDDRDNGIGFYEPHEPAEIIRSRGETK